MLSTIYMLSTLDIFVKSAKLHAQQLVRLDIYQKEAKIIWNTGFEGHHKTKSLLQEICKQAK